MDDATVVKKLEDEWDFDGGFFGLLRRGKFDTETLNRLVAILTKIDIGDANTINRRVVSLLWYMPLFMEWQRERVKEAGGDLVEFEKATNQVQGLVELILGIP